MGDKILRLVHSAAAEPPLSDAEPAPALQAWAAAEREAWAAAERLAEIGRAALADAEDAVADAYELAYSAAETGLDDARNVTPAAAAAIAAAERERLAWAERLAALGWRRVSGAVLAAEPRSVWADNPDRALDRRVLAYIHATAAQQGSTRVRFTDGLLAQACVTSLREVRAALRRLAASGWLAPHDSDEPTARVWDVSIPAGRQPWAGAGLPERPKRPPLETVLASGEHLEAALLWWLLGTEPSAALTFTAAAWLLGFEPRDTRYLLYDLRDVGLAFFAGRGWLAVETEPREVGELLRQGLGQTQP